jgi:hypothetical protein
MRENLKSGSVRGLIVTSEPILQQKVDYEPYLTNSFSISFFPVKTKISVEQIPSKGAITALSR